MPSNKIKLENIHKGSYDRQNGKLTVAVTTEYVCENCRRLIASTDVYCYFCGKVLQNSSKTEHYSSGRKLTDQQYNVAKTLSDENFENYIKNIPEPWAVGFPEPEPKEQ